MNPSSSVPYGGLVTLAVLVPNIIFVFFPPRDLPPARRETTGRTLRLLGGVEHVARVGVFATPFFCAFVPLHPIETTALVVLLAALGVYYLCWFRYFWRRRAAWLLYQPFWGVPVPLAVSPAIYFGAASVLLHAPWLAMAAVLLALSHIPLACREARRLRTMPGRCDA